MAWQPLTAAAPAATLPGQELLRALPADLFRTCLARVLMVMFDILVSHFHMVGGWAGGLTRVVVHLVAGGQASSV